MKIAETMQGSDELNGCQPDNDYGLDDSYLW